MNVLENVLSVKGKVLSLVGVFLFAMGLSSAYSLLTMNDIGKQITSIAERDLPLTRLLTSLTAHQLTQAVAFEQALRHGERIQASTGAGARFDEAGKRFDKLTARIEDALNQAATRAADDLQRAQTEDGRKEFQRVVEAVESLKTEHGNYVHHAHQAFALLEGGGIQQAELLGEKIEKEQQGFDHELEVLLLAVEKFTEAAALTAEEHEARAVIVLLLIAAIGLGVSVLIAVMVVRSVSKGLSRAVDTAQTIAQGDLSRPVEVKGNDEIGRLLQALAAMRSDLHGVVSKIDASTDELASASEELATVNEQTSQGVYEQQSQINQLATALNEMTASVHDVARSAADAASAARHADEEAQGGKAVVGQAVIAIEGLARDMEQASGVIHQLEVNSQNIGAVLDVIRGIAEQTNLLALNAAIEAARAGEQGRGFAVVADEVRTLAQRTQQSTQEIQTMVEALQSSAQDAVRVMGGSRDRADSTMSQAEKGGASLAAITVAVASISDMNTQIASAAEEQSAVSEEINRNVTAINTVAEQAAQGSQHTAQASIELARLATELRGLVDHFKL